MGAHGVGEIGLPGVVAAIANAVLNATGIRVRDLPITVDKILAGQKRQQTDSPPAAATRLSHHL